MKSNQTASLRPSQALAMILAFSALITAGVLSADTLSPDSLRLTPQTYTVDSSPTLPAEVRSLESQSVANLFDRDTVTEHTAFAASSVVAQLDSVTEVRAIKLFGAAPYALSVQAEQSGAWQPVAGLQNLNLATRSESWHTFTASAPVTTGKLRFDFTPTAGSTASGLKAIEIWGQGARINVRDGLTLLTALRGATPPAHAKLYPAAEAQGVVAAASDDPADNTFTVNLDRDPRQIKRAYLAYEMIGLTHWVGAVRSINGQAAQGGFPVAAGSDWAAQVEPLHPGWLTSGNNRIAFSAPAGLAGSYTVRNVYLVAEFDNGANFVGRVGVNQSEENNPSRHTVDGDLATGWTPYAQGGASSPTLSFNFDQPTQLDGVAFYLSNPLKGTLALELLRNGTWAASGAAAADARQFAVGWNRLAVPVGAPADGLRMVFAGGQGGGAELKEVQIVGSAVGAAFAPHFVTAFPDAGQFFGRTAHLRGYLEPLANASGPAQIFAGPLAVPSSDGAFAVNVTKEDVGLFTQTDEDPWSVDLRAVYPNGETVTAVVNLTRHQLATELADGSRLSTYRQSVAPGQVKKLAYGGAVLDLPADALAGDTTIGITLLDDADLPTLDTGMTNVTKGPRRGYRFTPTPKKFNNKLKVTLPYSKSAIPAGQSDDDVRTFYFDTETGAWQALERVAVDAQAQTVTSLTDHFTDMINATITVPDHPQAANFNPTLIKDIKAADPGAKINLIEPPRANNTGDARLSYPIEVPPGRGGLQPQLAVQYSSGGGNGWLGLGWDLPLQAISIDTRWGVPRYDGALETETYVLNGEQLTPLAHRGELVARSAEKVFHTRVEGQFRKIVRHGSHPANYWWEVVDKNGTRYFYGGGPDTSNAPAATSTLTDDQNNVFLWALREIRDANGNFVKFHTVRQADSGVVDGGVPGSNLYLQRVTYTGHGGAEGPYAVSFFRDRDLGEARRPDVQIDARGGFKRVTADLLRRADVTLNGQLIRRYDFAYQTGAFNKTLLKSVSQLDENGAFFNKHDFAYFDESRNEQGQYNGFTPVQDWAVGADQVGVTLRGNPSASALGGTEGDSVGGHIYVGIGPPGSSGKTNTGGLKIGYSKSKSETLIAMADMNGDGLPDKVFRGGGFHYRPNLSGPHGQPAFGEAVPLPSLPAISKESVTSLTFGNEAYFIIPVLDDRQRSTTRSDTYLADVNGDGLTDLVSGGRVLFGYLNAAGVPTFSLNSQDTPAPVGTGAVLTEGLLEDASALEAEAAKNFPLLDTLRRWVAPFDGVIRVDAPVQLIQDTSPARAEYIHADGVRVAVQLERNELWSARIAADDYTVHTPAGLDTIPVRRGDRLYFRAQSVFDGAYDQVAWNPQINYVGVANPALQDVNGQSVYSYRASEDFTLFGRPGTATMPLKGTLHVEGKLSKARVTSDDLALILTRNGQEVYRLPVGHQQTGDVAIVQDLQVVAQDTLTWRIAADSPIDASAVTADLQAWYTAAEGLSEVTDEAGKPVVKVTMPVDLDLYPQSRLISPQAAWKVPQDGTVTVTPNLAFDFAGVSPAPTARIVLTVKRRTALLAKKEIPLTAGSLPAAAALSLSLPVTKDDELFFDFATTDAVVGEHLTTQGITVSYDGVTAETVTSDFHAPSGDITFPQAFRGWGAVGYNGNEARASAPIDQSLLVLDETFKPETAMVYPFMPDAGGRLWGLVDDHAWVQGDGVSASRLGPDDILEIRGEEFAGASAVARVSKSKNKSFSVIVGKSEGESRSVLDFQDLNGDRFPDVVGEGGVQYTAASGALEGERQGAGLGTSRRSDNQSLNASTDGAGTIGAANANARALVNPSGQASAPTGTQRSDMPSIGLSGDLGGGTSDTKEDLIDVNGDGLPDKVFDNGFVALNLGYRFATPESWGGGAINKGETINGGVSVGFNTGWYSMAGGISLGTSDSHTNETYVDINGDGLPDKAFPGQPLRVSFNTGTGFAAPVPWNTGIDGLARDRNLSLSGGVFFTINFQVWFIRFAINPGIHASTTAGRPEIAFRDMDGDGFVDHVTSRSSSELRVASNPIGRTNLLRSVQRPLGARIDLEYERDGNTYDLPQSRWLLNRVSVFDGFPGDGPDLQRTTLRYAAPKYNRLEREFYGYGEVTEEQRDTAANDALYRQVVRHYATDSYYTKGQLLRERSLDAAGRPWSETVNTYQLHDVATGIVPADPASTSATLFPQLVRTDRAFFEGQPTAGKTTHTEHSYDSLGNVVRFYDAGDLGSDDDVEARIAYSADDAACRANYLVGTPTRIEVFGATGAALRRREANVDCANGDVLQVRQYLHDNRAAVTDLTYAANGNLSSVTGPANAAGQRYRLDYTYDPIAATHVASIIDSFGYRSTATHDLRFGQVATTTDLNGQPTTYRYDGVGRVASVTGPYQQDSGAATLRFTYAPEAAVPYALTQHLDQDAAGTVKDPIETLLFTDGIKRVVQTKKDISLHFGPDTAPQAAMSVSGRVTFDAFGRSVETRYPSSETKGANTAFNAGVDPVPPTRTSYDVLDRPLATVLPDGSGTTLDYGFGADRAGLTQFETRVTDANGKQKATYRNVRELITAVKEPTRSATLWTSYAYDALKQIVRVEDDQHHLTRVDYDGLGRRIAIDNPDTGKTETGYDLAGNVVSKITANLRGQGRAIRYDYDHNRLTAVRYPLTTGHDVSYTYGAPGAPYNRAARITQVSSPAGTDERWYGPLGELIQQTRTIASATQGNSANSPETYTTAWQYDTWNRVQRIAYPDGEVLTYGYDAGGLLQSAVGEKAGAFTPYLRRLEYDKFEQRALLEAGNRLVTRYAYEPLTRRLCALTTAPAGQGSAACAASLDSAPVQDSYQALHYAYDPVGNILGLANAIPVPPANTFGGPSLQRFAYDDLYRLTEASGRYAYAPEKEHRYQLTLAYDSIHNLTAKNQSHIQVTPSGQQLPQKKTSYLWNYAYGPQPHAPTQIGERAFRYDANGNQTGWDHDANGTRRRLTWDEDNRLLEVADNGKTTRFVYDDAGERIIKRGAQGETAYVNAQYTVRNRSVATKHIYAGTTRLAARMVPGTGNGASGLSASSLPRLSSSQPGAGSVYRADRAMNTLGSGFRPPDLVAAPAPAGARPRGLVGKLFAQADALGGFPGQGLVNRSARADEVAQNTVRNPHLVGRVGGAVGDLAPAPEDNFLYFYHPDHLGSTALVTDSRGQRFEHLEYFPFGETWVEERSNTQRTPYLFTGKELDEETNLYYFGARYYDPRTSVWQSADPILEKYLPSGDKERDENLAGFGGVFNSKNLGMYGYGGLNPVRYYDPDGREYLETAKEGRDLYGKGTSGKGHHWVPFDSVKGMDVSSDARAVFGQTVSGEKLPQGVDHKSNTEHNRYNSAVSSELKDFAKERDIDLDKMTKDEAKAFVGHVKTSNNPDIKPLVGRINTYHATTKGWTAARKALYKAFAAVGWVSFAEQTISTQTDACKATNCAALENE